LLPPLSRDCTAASIRYRALMAIRLPNAKTVLGSLAAVSVTLLGAIALAGPATSETSRARPAASGAMVRIPAGTLTLSPDPDAPPGARGRSVTIPAFEMDRTEVTVAEYGACVEAGGCTEAAQGSRNDACNWKRPERGSHPINCVDWDQAKAFCSWSGKRLPTAAEWEYAARGTDGRKYPWGNGSPDDQLCWSGRNPRDTTCEVGRYPGGASPFGLLDMAGNVAEWTSTVLSPAYARRLGLIGRFVQSGNWFVFLSDGSSVYSAGPRDFYPDDEADFRGFRCAR